MNNLRFDFGEILSNFVVFFISMVSLFTIFVVFPVSLYYEGTQLCKDGVVYTKSFTQGTYIEDEKYKNVKCTEKRVLK